MLSGGGTLTRRAVLAGCLVALVSVLATAAVAVPLANQAARRQAAEALATEAALAAAVLRPERARPAIAERIAAGLARQDIALWLVEDGVPDRAGLPAPVLARLAAGEPVTLRRARVSGRLALVSGRPLGGGDAVVLTRPFAAGIGIVVLPALWVPLLAGGLAGAGAGLLLARRLARPLRRAAAAAARLGDGDRAVRVPVEPPAESAQLADALNALAAALATSEGRQREFLLSISHELRTPLTTLKGYAEALADQVVAGDEVPEAGRRMLSEAEHLERLISDLLALARLEADDFAVEQRPVDLTALVGEIAAAWAPRFATAGVAWRTELPSEPVWGHTDPSRLRQVLDGLVGNALRVVPPGAPVVVRLAPGERAGEVDAGSVVVEVRDGGPGLTDEDLAVAFDRGALAERYRGRRKVGSGLGLALAARLVRRLGGEVAAGHAPEGGARFTLTLPAYVARTQP
jgi:two-component system OmpR family sensor kinase